MCIRDRANFAFWFCFGWLGPSCQKSVPGSKSPSNHKLRAAGLRACGRGGAFCPIAVSSRRAMCKWSCTRPRTDLGPRAALKVLLTAAPAPTPDLSPRPPPHLPPIPSPPPLLDQLGVRHERPLCQPGGCQQHSEFGVVKQTPHRPGVIKDSGPMVLPSRPAAVTAGRAEPWAPSR